MDNWTEQIAREIIRWSVRHAEAADFSDLIEHFQHVSHVFAIGEFGHIKPEPGKRCAPVDADMIRSVYP